MGKSNAACHIEIQRKFHPRKSMEKLTGSQSIYTTFVTSGALQDCDCSSYFCTPPAGSLRRGSV